MADNAPSIIRRTGRARSSEQEVWLRLSAFLSMKAPNTQITYKGILTEWCAFLGAQAGTEDGARLIASADELHAMAYKNWLEGRPGQRPRFSTSGGSGQELSTHRAKAQKKSGLESTQSNATIAKKFAALRRMYRMLASCGLCTGNPFDSDRVPAPPKDSGRKRPTEMVSFNKVKSVIEAADESTPKGLRDKAILAALFGGALRRSEAASLRVGDVRRTSAGTIFLYLRSTKAKKDAQQALPKWASDIILRLVKARSKEGAAPGDFLFVSYTGKGGLVPTRAQVSTSGLYKLFKSYCRKAGAGPNVTPHSARATAITRLLDQGIPHREVQEFSRHSSIQMVELYDKRRMGVDQNPAKVLDYDD